MVTIRTDGRTAFKFLAPQARRVQVVGEFTDWLARPIEMAPGRDGWWRVSTRIPHGEYRFRYLVDGRWVTDFAAFGVIRNDFGQFDGILLVSRAAGKQSQPFAAS